MTTPSDVKEFYDEFAGRVLMRDFYFLNLRQDAIRRLCKKFIKRNDRVLEIGCGVGIITKYLQSISSYVLAVDIGENNVRIAREYAASRNCEVRRLDIIEEADKLGSDQKFDVVLLPDVIEHIPKSNYRKLFATIEGVLADGGRVIITHPTPEVQEYLKAHKPEVMQVVDEHVELSDILGATSLKPVFFSYRDISGRNEYVHLVLTSNREYSEAGPKKSVVDHFVYRLRKYRWRFSNLAFLKRIRKLGPKD